MASGWLNFQLSCEIMGHSADVRAVETQGSGPQQNLLTASRDGTACVWCPDAGSNREFVLSKTINSHTGYVSSLCVIPADVAAGRGKSLVVTGGQDNTILVHSLDMDVGEPLERYVGHQGLVTCLIYQHNQLISGSWDSTVRVWKSGCGSEVIEAHKPAVWAIAGLFAFDGTNRILTGGADRVVRLWEVDTKMCIQEYSGHGDVVRDVKVSSHELFLSASNDCVIREWSIHSGLCLREMYGHEAFVYSLALMPSRSDVDFVSCGEDGTIRVWQGDVCKQVIRVPATSVWSVAVETNGDIVAGSSDGVARVFTINAEKVAPPQEIAIFNSKVVEHNSATKKSNIDISKLPGMEALHTSGHTNGDTLMVNNEGVPEVYQWNVDVSEWIKIGNAIGKAPENSHVYNGKEYDFVFEIELDEGPPPKNTLKLPYNRTTDPYIAAEDFLSANSLPASYLDQVAEFIIQNTGNSSGSLSSMAADPFTGGSRYVPDSGGAVQERGSDSFSGKNQYQTSADDPEVGSSSMGGAADPFTGRGGYRPVAFNQPPANKPGITVKFQGSQLSETNLFPLTNYKFFESAGEYAGKIMGKVREFNQVIDQSQQLTADQLTATEVLCCVFTCGSVTTSVSDLSLINKLLDWPSQNLFPGLDIVRLALLSDVGHKHLIPDQHTGAEFVRIMTSFALGPHSQSKNLLLVLRSLANVFSQDAGVQLMDSIRSKVLSDLCKLYPSCTSRPSQIALATVVLNYSHYYSKNEKFDGYMECTEHICKLIDSSFDAEAKFRALISLGSLTSVSKEAVKLSAQPRDLIAMARGLATSSDMEKVRRCAEAVLESLK
ncbi:phospholipase A-2-activating protein-like [Halichondria panicea]|uniref:phospholipase A-2-activating protein-like n=1 Tax=Halichondria panicea TaxID=6063 RepID=UPI00312B35C4